MKRKFIGFETDAEVDKVVEAERKRLTTLRGKHVGKSAAVRLLILKGSKVEEKAGA